MHLKKGLFIGVAVLGLGLVGAGIPGNTSPRNQITAYADDTSTEQIDLHLVFPSGDSMSPGAYMTEADRGKITYGALLASYEDHNQMLPGGVTAELQAISNIESQIWTPEQASKVTTFAQTPTSILAELTEEKIEESITAQASVLNNRFIPWMIDSSTHTKRLFNKEAFRASGEQTAEFAGTASDSVVVNYTLPVEPIDTTMKITYKMADGTKLPTEVTSLADSSTSTDGKAVTKLIYGYSKGTDHAAETYSDAKYHYLIPEVPGYVADKDQVTFDNSKLDADGNQDVTVTYAKPASSSESTATATTTDSMPKQTTTPTFKVYGKRALYRYTNRNFKKSERVQGYAKKAKMYAPTFTVVDTVKSDVGNLRYQLADGTYITAQPSYVANDYWQGKHYTQLYVTNPKGINTYGTTTFKNQLSHLKQNQAVTVTQVVKKGTMTRYELTDGTYITGNKQFVSPTKPTMPTRVKAKTKVRLYQTVGLKQVRKTYKKGTFITVKGWDYSHRTNTSLTGTKRYRVATGYITANPKFVQVMH